MRRSIVYRLKNDNEKADADFSKSVELGLTESEAYANRASVYTRIRDYEHARADYSSAIDLDPRNPDLYAQRARTYWGLNKGVDSLQDFAAALDLHLSRESLVDFLEGPLHEISNSILTGGDDWGYFPANYPLSTRLRELYRDILEKYPDVPDVYLHRGIYCMSTLPIKSK